MIAARSSGVRFLTLSMLAISAAVTALPASAQDVVREDDKPDLQFFVGLGLQVRPSFPGADSYDLGPLPVIRVRREGEPLPIRSPDQNTAFRLLGKRDGVSVGGTFNFQSARKEKDVGAPVGNVDFTFEPGVFAQGFLSDNLRLRAEVRRGIGGHNAFVGDVAADYVLRGADDRFVATIGPRVRLADARYNRRYFGVSLDRAVATGLPAFDTSAGTYAVGATVGLLYRFSPRWAGYGYAGYDRLTGDAARSPITRAYGSRDQYSAGIALTYNFIVTR